MSLPRPARVRELQQEMDDAAARHDLARAERAREEMDRIVEHLLSGALGLSGRSRALGSASERARSVVTWRIRNAIRKIARPIRASTATSTTLCTLARSACIDPRRRWTGVPELEQKGAGMDSYGAKAGNRRLFITADLRASV